MTKARKPREFFLRGKSSRRVMACADCRKSTCGAWYITAEANVALTAAEARRLAAWLVRAAEWIEGQGK